LIILLTIPPPPCYHHLLQRDSKFAASYACGVHKSKYWEMMYEDSLDLIAKLPQIAAMIYRKEFKNGEFIEPHPQLDWAANLSYMMGGCTF
jgi:citrate synthase